MPEVTTLAKTIEASRPQVLAFIDTGITNAGTEANSRLIKDAARITFGFRNLDNQSNTAAKDAARAAAEGRKIFVFKFDMPNLNSAVTGSVSGAAQVVEAIEDQGWVMSEMAVHPSVRHGAMVMLFRRR